MASYAPLGDLHIETPGPASNQTVDETTGAPVATAVPDDLPPPNARRWYRRDKRKVIAAVRRGSLDFREACRRYRLSYEEFVDWERLSGADDRIRQARRDHDRRRFHRIAMRSPASLRVAGHRIDCEIENLSATGALLIVDDSRTYPSQVALEVPHCRNALSARVAWRGRNALGIEFAAAPSLVAAQFDNRWIEGANALSLEAR
jgi:hypothetical protein